ncbi:MAG: hypothetical protein R3Y38_04905 [Rikenellaceae bacterium]
MLKRLLPLILLLLCVCSYAQETKEKTAKPEDKEIEIDEVVVTAEVETIYSKTSISFVVLERGDKLDMTIDTTAQNITLLGKYNKNIIDTKRIYVGRSRASVIDSDTISKYVHNSTIAKEVVSQWFNRDEHGVMDLYKFLERNEKNPDATMRAYTSKDDVLNNIAHELISGSYIVVLDYYRLAKGKDPRTRALLMTTNVTASVYKLEYTKELHEKVVQTWVNEDDAPEVKKQKLELFESLDFKLNFYTTIDSFVAVNFRQGFDSLVLNACYSALSLVEESFVDWKHDVTISNLKPIQARIGLKEGMRTGDRFKAYTFKESKRTGETKPKKVGYLRATQIGDNKKFLVSSNTPSSFFQISGLKRVELGMMVEEADDLGVTFNATTSMGDGLTTFSVGADILVGATSFGANHYVLSELGYDFLTHKDYMVDNYFKDIFKFYNFQVGYGFGYKPVRYIEFMPFGTGGIEFMDAKTSLVADYGYSDYQENKKTLFLAYFLRYGCKMNLSFLYPLQFTIGIDYTTIVAQNEAYKLYNKSFDTKSQYQDEGISKRMGGLGYSFGVGVSF